MAKGQFNIKIDLPLIFWMIALLAAHKPLLLLDFHRSLNDTRTMRSVLSGFEDPTRGAPHFLSLNWRSVLRSRLAKGFAP